MAHVLVAHASRHGSTTQVAERIAGRVQASGHLADCCPARTVRDPVGGYQLVVIGGALYSGRWHADARRFLKRHRSELTALPVAVFGMGPRSDDPESWDRSRAQLDRALARLPWLHPIAVTVFGGVDPAPRHGLPPRDARDWPSIDRWADDLLAWTRTTGDPK